MAETTPTPSPASDAGTGLEGVITVSPIHGGPIKEGEESSGPLVKKAFVVKQDERVVGEFETDEKGRFRIVLPAGRYTVEGKNPKHRFEHYGPMNVAVEAGKMTSVKWDFDTGLR
jgi:hypothetical protein